MADKTQYSYYADPIRIRRYAEQFATFTKTERPNTRLIFSGEYYSVRRCLT